MGRDLLLEVGTEEIPAAFLPGAQGELARRAAQAFAGARLGVESIRTAGTPRRIVLMAHGLAEVQADLREQAVGPPADIAFDRAGVATKAAVGFAKRHGVDVSCIERAAVEGRKGEYAVCTVRRPGATARQVLPGLLGDLLAALPWPKSMRWASGEQLFVRPVHWLVALFAGEVVPMSFAGVAAGRLTRGHRFLAPGWIELDGNPDQYLEALRRAWVLADPASRRDMVIAELDRIEKETGVVVRRDEALVVEVTDLVEYPVGVWGEFAAAYLEVPEEVIVSAMRSHQRYFATETRAGELANRFVAIAGTVTANRDRVREGNERVLAARLADAQFFFREDRKIRLAKWAEKLDEVIFQAELGSVGDKIRRIVASSAALCAATGVDAAAASRAAALCKADLVTHMVGEFPELQGIMGRHYARLDGELEVVAEAIAEHYRPRTARDALPASDVAAVVALADRIDTVVGCFAAGLAPTGSADPYGLRRAALAILSILRQRSWRLELGSLIAGAAAHLVASGVDVGQGHREQVLEFFRTRLRGLLVDGEGMPADCVEAALAAGLSDVPDLAARAAAVAALRHRDDFEPLAIAFKRVANILRGENAAGEPDPARFHEDEERTLWTAFRDVKSRVDSFLGAGDYQRSLQVLAELKGPVDRFFAAVLVMAEDEAVRRNRLALLARINATFTRIADFRQLTVGP